MEALFSTGIDIMNTAHKSFNFAINWQPNIIQNMGRWTFDDIEGNHWPIMFATKHEAAEAAALHKRMVCRQAMESITTARGAQ
jgi:hypothetical protein